MSWEINSGLQASQHVSLLTGLSCQPLNRFKQLVCLTYIYGTKLICKKFFLSGAVTIVTFSQSPCGIGTAGWEVNLHRTDVRVDGVLPPQYSWVAVAVARFVLLLSLLFLLFLIYFLPYSSLLYVVFFSLVRLY